MTVPVFIFPPLLFPAGMRIGQISSDSHSGLKISLPTLIPLRLRHTVIPILKQQFDAVVFLIFILIVTNG